MVIIIDTYGGLCNQMYDIQCCINFCIINNFHFAFRYCSFRHPNLASWYNRNFNELFDTTAFQRYENYIEFENLQLTPDNTYNLEGVLSNRLFSDNYLSEIKNINKIYIVLKQFWAIYKFCKIVDNIYPRILPSSRLMIIYNKVKDNLDLTNEKYNFIHYRYEPDFTNHFKIEVDSLENIIIKINTQFKNPNLKLFIGSSKTEVRLDNLNICFKKCDESLKDYNFEELAFIDFMIGLNSNEVFGHKNSSFSGLLNNLKQTQNYYNI